MKKHYPWLWFDADGTLFDYSGAEGTALERTFQALDLPFDEMVLATYRPINRQLWQALERDEITPAFLQLRRFELLFEALQLTESPKEFGDLFLEHLGQCSELLDGAYEVLAKLHTTSRIAIVTNGFEVVQRNRLARSPIGKFITEVIVSEQVGAAKPKAAFFEAASARTGFPAKQDVLIIGDSLASDMRGGVDYGLDTCWFNPAGATRPEDLAITYEIGELRELLGLVG
ncbi:MAG: YjjG family noncanonical pyrimidine nucleotidase [Anaerolineales bacterium]